METVKIKTGTEQTFGEKLHALRISSGLSQKALGEELGLCSRQIRRFEKSESMPCREVMRKMAVLFQVSVVELLSSEFLIGAERTIDILRPYVELHLAEVSRRMRATADEILSLEQQPILDNYSKNRIKELQEELQGERRYFSQITKELELVGC